MMTASKTRKKYQRRRRGLPQGPGLDHHKPAVDIEEDEDDDDDEEDGEYGEDDDDDGTEPEDEEDEDE
jgi:hypothetical protein